MRLPPSPHPWTLGVRDAIALQRRLAGEVRSRLPPGAPLRYVAGVDAAFSGDGRTVIAACVLWDLLEGSVVEWRSAVRRVRFPYVPGLLSFREAPAVLAALRKLRAEPDAILCDAHGRAHPRRFGMACHVGLLAGRPTVGCAKSRLVGQHEDPPVARGSWRPLLDGRRVIGSVLRTQEGVRPVYVSVGHLIDLAAARRLVLACAVRYRLPEPSRLADQLVRAIKAGRAADFAAMVTVRVSKRH
ncbi:Endonuclease V [bacterium HR33]|nr:Endonuclease V [bacterium HR33]